MKHFVIVNDLIFYSEDEVATIWKENVSAMEGKSRVMVGAGSRSL